MIAANLDSLLFFLLVAVAVLFQLLSKAAGKTGKNQPRRTSTPTPKTPPPIPRAPTESNEEKIRKLLEALGQPPTSKPPAPVAPRTGIPPHPLAPVQPPISPLSQLSREKRRKGHVVLGETRPSETVRHAEEIDAPKITSASAFDVHEGPLPIAPLPIFKAPAEADADRMRISATTEKPETDIA